MNEFADTDERLIWSHNELRDFIIQTMKEVLTIEMVKGESYNGGMNGGSMFTTTEEVVLKVDGEAV